LKILNCTKLYISQRTIENCKNISNSCYKNVSFAFLNGWKMTKTSFDNA
jgi:hypothetical protein